MGCSRPHRGAPLGSVSSVPTAVRDQTVIAWLHEAQASVTGRADYLTQLDAAIGDGDHGINMTRGFDAVGKALAAQGADTPPGRILVLAGKTLVSTVGGASGPLWGSALRAAGRSLGDAEDVDGPQLAAALDAALAAVVSLGAAQPGDKTMVDALTPATATLRERLDAGATIAEAVTAAADAAEAGAQATAPMQARKGRASYLGERSIGHQDPGATSAALIMRALQTAVTQDVVALPRIETALRGVPASPGIGVGAVRRLAAPVSAGAVVPEDRRAAETERALDALAAAAGQLDALAARLRADGRDSGRRDRRDRRADGARPRSRGRREGGRRRRACRHRTRSSQRVRRRPTCSPRWRTRCSPRGPTTSAAWAAGRRCIAAGAVPAIADGRDFVLVADDLGPGRGRRTGHRRAGRRARGRRRDHARGDRGAVARDPAGRGAR